MGRLPDEQTPGAGVSRRCGVRVKEPEALGRLIRERRKSQGATLAQAAGLSGVGVRFLLELEHGKPTAELGKALQVLERMGLELWVAPRGTRPREDGE